MGYGYLVSLLLVLTFTVQKAGMPSRYSHESAGSQSLISLWTVFTIRATTWSWFHETALVRDCKYHLVLAYRGSETWCPWGLGEELFLVSQKGRGEGKDGMD